MHRADLMETERLWEIDSLRGIAIILMVISNLATDMAFFRVFGIDAYSGFWLILARLVVSMFILLAGVSLTLSYSRVRSKKTGEIRRKFILRGLGIFGWGLAITAVTWVFIPGGFVLFGVLHLIGFSVIFGHFLARRRLLCLLLGFVLLFGGLYLQAFSFGFPWLAWLGMRPEGYFSVDYVPVLPWFGIFLVGIYMGNTLYPQGKRRLRTRDFSGSLFVRPLTFLGRNSLRIYIVHQPILIALLWLLFPFPQGFLF